MVANESLSSDQNTDEISLTDGTKILGSIMIEENGDHFSIKHPLVGNLRVPINNVHSLKRRPKNVAWLSDLRAKTYEATGPVIPPPSPKKVEPTSAAHSALMVNPKSRITYTVPALGNGKIIFRSTLAPCIGNRGSVTTCLLYTSPSPRD